MPHYMKPAYYGVREAIENYFGRAFVVRDAAGAELVRFASTGNVIVLKGTVTAGDEAQAVIEEKAVISPSFIVRNADEDPVAVVNPDGNVYVAGDVWQREESLTGPAEQTALIVRDAEQVLSFIDDEGNLKLRGEVIVKGIPYSLLCYMDGDPDPPDDPYLP